MFELSSEDLHQERAQAGVRHLFRIGNFTFEDTVDEAGGMHHFVRASGDPEGDVAFYEADRYTMYEFLARYLAGEYEKQEYDMDRSPGHAALLDLLELATARARAGESDFSIDELDEGINEDMDDDEEERTE
jgi:hypothetical protein